MYLFDLCDVIGVIAGYLRLISVLKRFFLNLSLISRPVSGDVMSN
jgi:hypothetical protein